MKQSSTWKTLQKFAQMTNAEAYVEVFHNLLMRPFPDTDLTGQYWGSSSRADFYPHLRELLYELSYSASFQDLNILDVGAGSGEMVDHMLRYFPAKVYAIEPNPLMLRNYYEAIERSENLHLSATYTESVQSLYSNQSQKTNWLTALPQQNLILASHMVYALTPAISVQRIDFQAEIRNFIASMYEKLAVNGALFLVYAIGENSLLGEAAAFHMGKVDKRFEKNVRNAWHSRFHLLESGGVVPYLEDLFPDFDCEFSAMRTTTKIYGNCIDDIAKICLLGEQTEVNDDRFDIAKLEHNYEFILKHTDRIQATVGGIRDGMLSVSAPQVICTIRKRAKKA